MGLLEQRGRCRSCWPSAWCALAVGARIAVLVSVIRAFVARREPDAVSIADGNPDIEVSFRRARLVRRAAAGQAEREGVHGGVA